MSGTLLPTLLRRPRGAEIVADVVRALSALSIVVAAIGWSIPDALNLAAATALTFVPRALGVRPAFDIAFSVVTVIATWCIVTDLYHTMRWVDIPIHFALNGLMAALAYLILRRLRVLDDPWDTREPILAIVITTGALGLALGVFWEWYEWFAKNFIDPEMLVGYEDSLLDMAVGGAGAVLAGFLVPFLLDRNRVVHPQGDGSDGAGSAGREGSGERESATRDR